MVRVWQPVLHNATSQYCFSQALQRRDLLTRDLFNIPNLSKQSHWPLSYTQYY